MKIKKHIIVAVFLIFASALNLRASMGDVVSAAKFDNLHLNKGVPAGWQLDVKKGKQVVDLVKVGGGGGTQCLYLYSNKASFGLKKAVRVDIREYPYLNWQWAATKLPQGGDGRKSCTDDQVLQIYVAFPAVGWPEKLNTPVLGYLWDNEAPKNECGKSPQVGGSKLRYYIVKNKTDRLNQWHSEKRNIYDDYKKLFSDINGGEPSGLTQGIAIYINSQHTGTQAEGFVGEIFFSKN